MKPRLIRLVFIAGMLVLCAAAPWILRSRRQTTNPDDKQGGAASQRQDESALPKGGVSSGTGGREDSGFPVNDKIEMPFLGTVECHARQEKVQFTANGERKEWPFKVYYLPNGMFVRAEFFKPGAKDYEFDVKNMEGFYRSTGQILAGFPERAASASLAKVLQSLYTNEAFDRATKINITYVLLDETELGSKIQPCFIANIWGVSPGILTGSVPEDDEAFQKYRVFLDQNGVPTFTDNGL